MANTIENIKYFWKDLPKWAKGITIVAAIGIPSYIAYTVYKNKKYEAERIKKLEDMKSVEDTINKLQNSGQKPTYEISQYKLFADDLFEAMDGCGTSVRKIYDVFDKMQNDLDVNLLISAYGIDRVLTCSIIGVSDVKGGLASHLASELGLGVLTLSYLCSNGERCTGMYELRVVNCILSKKGIKTQF